VNSSDIIAHLNTLLKSKLTGINQYFLHARMLKHKGVVKLADYEYKMSIDAMKHADMLVERVLTLGGMPQLSELGELHVGNDERSMMEGDLAHSQMVLQQLMEAVALCKSAGDEVTAALLGRIIDSQREQAEFIQTQINPKAA